MTVFLVILLVLAALATLGALIRGIVIFLQTTRADLEGRGPSVSGLKQNKAMQLRILFQALAILIVIVLLLVGRHGG